MAVVDRPDVYDRHDVHDRPDVWRVERMLLTAAALIFAVSFMFLVMWLTLSEPKTKLYEADNMSALRSRSRRTAGNGSRGRRAVTFEDPLPF